jgi:Ala-tRNA(Pro) deacylase
VAIYSLLDQLVIPYQRIDHPPVFTCEEASKLLPDLPAAKTKNLFLRDPKSERLFLVVSPEEHVAGLATQGNQHRLVRLLG